MKPRVVSSKGVDVWIEEKRQGMGRSLKYVVRDPDGNVNRYPNASEAEKVLSSLLQDAREAERLLKELVKS
jgi:hypothetical protein